MKILLKPLAELSHCLSKRFLEVPDGQSVGMVLRELGRRNPSFREALFDEQHRVSARDSRNIGWDVPMQANLSALLSTIKDREGDMGESLTIPFLNATNRIQGGFS